MSYEPAASSVRMRWLRRLLICLGISALAGVVFACWFANSRMLVHRACGDAWNLMGLGGAPATDRMLRAASPDPSGCYRVAFIGVGCTYCIGPNGEYVPGTYHGWIPRDRR